MQTPRTTLGGTQTCQLQSFLTQLALARIAGESIRRAESLVAGTSLTRHSIHGTVFNEAGLGQREYSPMDTMPSETSPGHQRLSPADALASNSGLGIVSMGLYSRWPRPASLLMVSIGRDCCA
jgi:hypothetical protein